MKPFLEQFGTSDKGDTASYESVHRCMTVGLWSVTSRRIGSMNEEMAKQSMLLNHNNMNEFVHAVTTGNMNRYIKERGPYVAPEFVEIKAISNLMGYPLRVDLADNRFRSTEDHYERLLTSTRVTNEELSNVVRGQFGIEGWALLSRNPDPVTLRVVQAVSIEGNEESRLGKVIIYATHKFQNTRPRHDFVIVQQAEGENQPAQLCVLLELSNADQTEVQYFAYVRYLLQVEAREETPARYQCPFPVFRWELGAYEQGRGRNRRTRSTVTQLIDVSSIVSPAFMTPVYHLNRNTPVSSKPEQTDRFWYICRQYCDRAGWDDVNMVDVDQPIAPEVDEVVINIPAAVMENNLVVDPVVNDDIYVDSNSEEEDPFGDCLDTSSDED